MPVPRWSFWLILGAISAPALAGMQHETVVALDGQVVQLAQSGRARFADIVFPDAASADTWLAQHLLQQELSFEAGDTDRYGRTLITSDAEAAMLRDGVAVLFNQQPVPAAWIAAEQAARQARRGVWAQPAFVLAPENAAQHVNQFHVVEGAVMQVHKGRHATYINFGEDWHSDFTATIAGKYRRRFDATLSRIKDGARVRVRGMVVQENGPMLYLTRPEQLELI